MAKQIIIDPLSTVPLLLVCEHEGKQVGTATGFTVMRGGRRYLITNRHVVDDHKRPVDALHVHLHAIERLGTWRTLRLPLADHAQQPIWRGHPAGHEIDLVRVPLELPGTGTAFDLDLSLAGTDVLLGPSDPVSIIGFPESMASDGLFPIWKTGHLASDLDLDAMGLPAFLIDARTKSGMSGSPVVARRTGSYQSSKGFNVAAGATRFLGVYSGRRIERDLDRMDIGIVWKASALEELLGQDA